MAVNHMALLHKEVDIHLGSWLTMSILFLRKMKSVETMVRLGIVAAMTFIAGYPLSLLAGKQCVDEPWSVSSNDPVIVLSVFAKDPGFSAHRASLTSQASRRVAGQFDLGSSLPADFGYAWLRFYQKYLSSAGTTRCPMVPSCSSYSMLAINKHGLLKGVVMTADRLIHEADEKRWVKQVGKGNDAKYSDPLENNDFWWYKR